jgi:hypothetical protein
LLALPGLSLACSDFDFLACSQEFDVKMKAFKREEAKMQRLVRARIRLVLKIFIIR